VRLLEHRRHSLRRPGDPHLSPEGLARARALASTVGPFDRVVSSTATRSVETARALAGRVDETLDELRQVPDAVNERLERRPLTSFREFAHQIEEEAVVAAFARAQSTLWRRLLLGVPDGGRLLLVSHAAVIELGAIGALPSEAGTWGPAVAPLEGVQLVLKDGRWAEGRALRGTGPAPRS